MSKHEKVVFLDIDGVLQGYSSQKRFNFIKEMPTLQKELTEKHGVDYSSYDKYDVGAVYYDWDSHAVSLIRKILDETKAVIVVSSDWRLTEGGLQRMKDLFNLHSLGEYVVDVTDDLGNNDSINRAKEYEGCRIRTIEILEYVKKHPEIKKFVAIDDLDISVGLEGHFVRTSNVINDEECDECIKLLT
jgi:hypothetical protein